MSEVHLVQSTGSVSRDEMSAFHTPPWLKLIFGQSGPFDRS